MSSTMNNQRVVTRQDVALALRELEILPKRAAVDPQREFDSYMIGLQGVRVCDLATAVGAILSDALGHAFYPVPPELRRHCNLALEERATEMAKAARLQRERDERPRAVQHTAQQRARVAELYRRFLESLRPMTEAEELEAIRAKYDPAALDSIPDRQKE